MIYWTLDPEDWNTTDPDAIYDYVIQHVTDGSIVLSHETYESTLLAYQRIIPELLSQGYQIVTVTELLSHKQNNLHPGEVYPQIR